SVSKQFQILLVFDSRNYPYPVGCKTHVKTEERVVYTVDYRDRKSKGRVSVVTLKPPNAWHLDTAGNEQDMRWLITN
ncbi:MAG: hypothetical protein M1368_09780, partial [Thaumarchaeota archaeon]|nr:hypothetical protein [Nitrososphaerota archaeon]